MEISDHTKCVLIISETLSHGQQANVSAVLSMTLGSHFPEIVGPDIVDADGTIHAGITQLNLPILAATEDTLRIIKESAKDNTEIFSVDFSDIAQMSRHYDEYKDKLLQSHASELLYIGIGLIGDKKIINRLTGNLKLLR